jgi:hypothetical protein
VAERLHIPGALAASPEHGRVSLIFDEWLRGSGRVVPLTAILFLLPSSGAARLERVPAFEALRDVFALTFRLPTDGSRAACFARVADVTAQVQTLRLHRPMTVEALGEVVALIERHLPAAG